MNDTVPMALAIDTIHGVHPAADGDGLVLRAQVVESGGASRSPLEIAITTELAAAVALSLLATTARARRTRDEMEPALECFAAGVEDSSRHRDRVRLQLLFEGGTVLPVEMHRDAGEALMRELKDWLDGRVHAVPRRPSADGIDGLDGTAGLDGAAAPTPPSRTG